MARSVGRPWGQKRPAVPPTAAREAATDLPGDMQLTQLGSKRADGKPPFLNKPRVDVDYDGLSLTTGKETIEEAFPRVFRRSARVGDGVRYTSVDALIDKGFSVKRSPGRNPNHVSVSKKKWSDKDARAFDSCFDDPTWKEEDPK